MPKRKADAKEIQKFAGVPDGTVLVTHKYNPDTNLPDPAMGIEYKETVVHDFDKDGKVIGFHKEPLNKGKRG